MVKKTLSLLLSLILCLSVSVSLPICADAATRLTISGKSTAYVGCKDVLTVKINSKKISASKCTFASSNKAVATVSTSGVVMGVKVGTVTITARLKSNTKIKATFRITVKSNTLKTPAKSLNFAKGCSNTLVIYNGSTRVYGGDVTFYSSNKNVATVSASGKVTAKSKGSTIIKVTSKKASGMYINIKINVLDSTCFTISNTSYPLNGAYLSSSAYNSTTKTYYTIRSYLEYFENHPNCTLQLKSGKYNICNVLYIPSYTTIKLLDGVTLKKIYDTKTSKLTASATMIAFCEPSKASASGAYSEYNGVHNSKLLGYGNAKLDMSGQPDTKLCCTIVMCHNKNILVNGIDFTNLSYGHFIELDASYNVKIKNCSFSNQFHTNKKSSSECINLDTPDKNTGGFTQAWTSYDCTPNKYITVADCDFTNVQRGVGTHQYSQDMYHTNITVDNCRFTNCMYGGIYMMNWKELIITGNVFNGVGKDSKGNVINPDYISSDRAFLMAGCSGVNISENTFSNCYQVGAISNHQANGYDMIFNTLTTEELDLMSTKNYCGENVDNMCIKAYQNWDGNNAPYTVYNLTESV